MDQVDSNEDGYDPNEPDYTNGDLFCRLCLASMNSESMWASHIAGKRHIKNAQKYPKGLPRDHQGVGLSSRGHIDDEDSYERPPKRERFDGDYPPPRYEDNYCSDDYYKKRPPMDYVPVVKPNIVFDYGHTKKLEDTIPPPQMNKITAIPPSIVPPPSSTVPHVVPVVPVASTESLRLTSDEKAILDQLLLKSNIEKHQSEVKDDFFEKINQREMVKEIVRELSKQGILLNSIEKTDDDLKTSSSHDKYVKKKPDILDIFNANDDKKRIILDNERESKKKSSSSKKSSAKSKSVLDDLDPDELTPDVLDDLLNAHLKSKKDDSSAEICNKKQCAKNKVDLDDPKVIAQKLESLPTMEFLNITHKILINLKLKSTEELKMLMKIITEAQAAIRKNISPELQTLLNLKLSGNNNSNIQLPAQGTSISQNASSFPTNTISVASQPSSSKTALPVNPVSTSVSLQTPSALLPPLVSSTFPNIPVSPYQNSTSSFSNVVHPQNQVSFPYPLSAITTIPTMTPMQMAVTPTPGTSVTSVNNPASVQNFQSNAAQNYYRMIFSMCQNRQVVPPNVSNMYVNQRVSAVPTLSLPPPPPPPPPLSQRSKEVLNTVVESKNQGKQPFGQLKQKSSLSSYSQSKQSADILDTLKNLEALDKEFKKKQVETFHKKPRWN